MKKASPATIGAFVVGAIVLVVGGLLIFGSGRLFEDVDTYVMYFEDAVTGLSPGAPVLVGGVKVGEVVDIHATIDEGLDIDVPVIVKIGGGKVRPRGEPAEDFPAREKVIPVLIKRGMRAQLGTQSLVTGQLLISLKFEPEKEAVFRGDGSLPEIPTIPSPLSEIQERLQQLPLQEIASQALGVLQSIDRFVNSDELTASVRNLNRTLASVRALSDNVDAQLAPLSASAEDALSTLAEDSSTRYALDEALVELAAAARSIRILAEYLERHPESLLAGKNQGGP